MTNIIIADSHTLVRESVRSLLEKTGKFNVTGTAANGKEAVDLLQKGVNADIVLADSDLPVMNGVDMAETINKLSPDTSVVLFINGDQYENAVDAYKPGVKGLLFKDIDTDELFFALERVAQKKEYVSQELGLRLLKQTIDQPNTVPSTLTTSAFSPREMEVLRLVAEGFTNQEIADKLFTSRRTVEGHRLSLLGKAGVRNTSSLIRFAVRNRIID